MKSLAKMMIAVVGGIYVYEYIKSITSKNA